MVNVFGGHYKPLSQGDGFIQYIFAYRRFEHIPFDEIDIYA
jgi:hypothetical protein